MVLPLLLRELLPAATKTGLEGVLGESKSSESE